MKNFLLFLVLTFYTGVLGEDSIPSIFIHKNPYAHTETFNIPKNKNQGILNLAVSKLTPKDISGEVDGVNINFSPEKGESLNYFALKSLDNLPLNDILKGNYLRLNNFAIPMEIKDNFLSIKQNSFTNKLYLLGINKDNNTLEKLYQYKPDPHIRHLYISVDTFDSLIYFFDRPSIYGNFMGYVINDNLSTYTFNATPLINISGDQFTDLKDLVKENPIFIKDETSSFKELNPKDYTSCYIGWYGWNFQHFYPTYYNYNNTEMTIGINYNENNSKLLQFGLRNWDGSEFNHTYDIKQKNDIIKLSLHIGSLPTNEKGTLNVSFDPEAKGTYIFDRTGNLIANTNHISSSFSGGEYFTPDYGDKMTIDNKNCPLLDGNFPRHHYSNLETFNFKDSTFKVGFYNNGNLYLEIVKLGKENFTFPIKIYRKDQLVGDFNVNVFLSKKNTASFILDSRFPKDGFVNSRGMYINEQNERKDYSDLISSEIAATSKTPVTLEAINGNAPTSTSGNFKIFSKPEGTIKASITPLPEEDYIKENLYFKTNSLPFYDQYKYSNGDILLTNLIYRNHIKDLGNGSGEADITNIPINFPVAFQHSYRKYNKEPANSNLGTFALTNFQGYLPYPCGANKLNIITSLKVTINGETQNVNGSKFENDKYVLDLNGDGNFVLMKKNSSLSYTDNVTLQYFYKDLLMGTLHLKVLQDKQYTITKTIDVSVNAFDSMTYLYNRPDVYSNYIGYAIKDDLSQIEYEGMPQIKVRGDKFTELKNFSKNNSIFIKDDSNNPREVNSYDFTSCFISGRAIVFQHYYPVYYKYNNTMMAIGPNFKDDTSYNENKANLIQFAFKEWDGSEFNHSYEITQKNETVKVNIHVDPLPSNEKGILNIHLDPKAIGSYSFNRFGNPVNTNGHISSVFSGGKYLTADYGDKLVIDNKECPLSFWVFGRHRYSKMETFTFKDSTIKVGFYDYGNLYIEPVKLGKENFTFPIKLYRNNKLVGDFTVNVFLSKENTNSLTLDSRLPQGGFVNNKGIYINEKNEKKDYSELVFSEVDVTSKTPVTLETVNGIPASSTVGDFKIFSKKDGTIKGSLKSLPEEEYIRENVFFKTGSSYYDQFKYSNGDTLLTSLAYKNHIKDFGQGKGELNLSFIDINTPYTIKKSSDLYKKETLISTNNIPLIYNFTGYLPQVSGSHSSNIITSMVVDYNDERTTTPSSTFENKDFKISIDSQGQLVIKKKSTANFFHDYLKITFFYKDISLGNIYLDIISEKFSDLTYDFLLDNRMQGSFLYINGNNMAGHYQWSSAMGRITDYSELIEKSIPKGSDGQVNIMGPLTSDKYDAVEKYKFYTYEPNVYIGGDSYTHPEDYYLKNNIFFSTNIPYENKEIYLSNGRKVNVNLKFNSTKKFEGKGNINLTMAPINIPCTFEKNKKDYAHETINSSGDIPITDGQGYLPQVYGLRKNNIVTSMKVKINNGTEEIITGTKFENEKYSININNNGQMIITKKNSENYKDSLEIKYLYNEILLSTYTLNITSDGAPSPISATANIDKRFDGYLNLSGKGTVNDFSENFEDYGNIFQMNTPIEASKVKIIATTVEKATSSEQKGNYKIYTLDGNNKIAVKTIENSEDNYLKNNIFFKGKTPMNNIKIILNNGRALLLTTTLAETKIYTGSGMANITTVPSDVPYIFPYSNTSYNNQTVKSSGDFSLEQVQGYLPQPGGINKNNIVNNLKVIINGKVELSHGPTFENDKYFLSINEKGDLIFKKKNANITYEDDITLKYLYNNMVLGSLDLKLYNFPKQNIELFLDGRVKNCYSDLSGNGAEYIEEFFQGEKEDYSSLIHFKEEPQLSTYTTKIDTVTDSSSESIQHDYKYYYKDSDAEPCVVGKNDCSSEDSYVKKSIMLHFRTDTKNYNIQLDNSRKLEFTYRFNNNKVTSGKGELSLSDIPANSSSIINAICSANGAGTFPNGAGLNNNNIVDNLVITINGRKNIVKGSSFENDKYKIYFNSLGKMCFQKKNYNNSYEDTIVIEYYCTRLKLGDYTLKVK